jgi:hypothetical protein
MKVPGAKAMTKNKSALIRDDRIKRLGRVFSETRLLFLARVVSADFFSSRKANSRGEALRAADRAHISHMSADPTSSLHHRTRTHRRRHTRRTRHPLHTHGYCIRTPRTRRCRTRQTLHIQHCSCCNYWTGAPFGTPAIGKARPRRQAGKRASHNRNRHA